ncbi:MAG: hypothetical protein MZV64_41800 [Ignavibacteriales bacterium]|nr:hypothetical protein [Ignavibacteriales bacterium]
MKDSLDFVISGKTLTVNFIQLVTEDQLDLQSIQSKKTTQSFSSRLNNFKFWNCWLQPRMQVLPELVNEQSKD